MFLHRSLGFRSCNSIFRIQDPILKTIIRCYTQGESKASLLDEQKAKRPMSPISIYQPQLTWIMSITNRVTGVFVTAGIYGFGIYYGIAAPGQITGTLTNMLSETPASLVALGKMAFAWPFFYHSLNGVRHLVWDFGYALSLRGCYATGWMVNIGSVLLTGLVALI